MLGELSDEWARWLASIRWDYFLTITFRDAIPPHRAESVLNACGRSILRLQRKMLFLGAEQHVSSFLHIHGLYASTLPAGVIWGELWETYGRTKVERVGSQEAVAAYVTKYCVKDLAAYQLWGESVWGSMLPSRRLGVAWSA